MFDVYRQGETKQNKTIEKKLMRDFPEPPFSTDKLLVCFISTFNHVQAKQSGLSLDCSVIAY